MNLFKLTFLRIIFLSSLFASSGFCEEFKIRYFQRMNPTRVAQFTLHISNESLVTLTTLSAHPKGLLESNRVSDCVSEGGVYVRRIAPNLRKKLDDALSSAILEQKPLNPKGAPAKTSGPSDFFKVERITDKAFASVSVIDKTKPSAVKMLKTLDELYQEVVKSPVQALRMTTARSEGIKIEFKNIGKMPLVIPLPDRPHEAFHLASASRNKLDPAYSKKPKQESFKLKSSEVFSVELIVPKSDVTSVKEVRYDNHSILHHLPKNSVPVELSLCSSLP